jgi:N4-gp56 family major capsid protein
MAKTSFATGNALTKKLHDEKLFRDARIASYFSKFMGKGSDALVQEKTQLTKSKGDQITFGIRMRLTGAGVTSGQTLEGNEEKLTTHDYSVSLEQYRHAVRDNGELDRQRAMFDVDSESRTALKDWGSEKIDTLCFTQVLATPTRVFYRDNSGAVATTATAATAKAALDATNSKITPKLLDFTKAWALTGGNRSQTPLRPVKINGKNYFVFLAHPDVFYDLRQDSTWSQSVREALERSPKNPLFSGAYGVWNGMILHEHEGHTGLASMIDTNGGGGNVPWAKCSLMGAQSLVWAWGKRGKMVSETFDYQEEHGFAWSMMAAVGKPKFNSLDYGSVGIYVSRTRISDAS